MKTEFQSSEEDLDFIPKEIIEQQIEAAKRAKSESNNPIKKQSPILTIEELEQKYKQLREASENSG